MTKKKKKMCNQLDVNPYCSTEYMGLKSNMLTTRLRSSMQIIDKNICYMQKVVNRD